MKLTKQAKDKYIKSGGVRCPFCQSLDIYSIGSIEADESGATQEIECRNCGKEWTDQYELVDIIEDE